MRLERIQPIRHREEAERGWVALSFGLQSIMAFPHAQRKAYRTGDCRWSRANTVTRSCRIENLIPVRWFRAERVLSTSKLKEMESRPFLRVDSVENAHAESYY